VLRTTDQLGEQIGGIADCSQDKQRGAQIPGDLEDLSSYVSDLLATIPNAIYVVNPLGIIIDGNRALEQLAGWPLERILGERQSFLFENEPLLREIGRIDGEEAELVTRDRKTVPVCVFSQARQDSLGNMSHVVALVDNRRHRKIELELERAFFGFAETISRALGSRDPYTEEHGRRVADLCRLTGEKIGLTSEQLKGLYVGGLLHDVGKIAIPEIILAKPGRLTDEEYNLIRAHTKHGYSILKDTTMPWPIAEIAFSHHERLDGSGYPLGIDAKKLSLEIRIIGVCDVVEAMSSHRPYRPRRTERQVIKEMLSGKGGKYDADVVDAVLEIVKSGAFQLR
jgi:HD-GYP domain-containing protein (c-di-GMP phosphodiesterase class II)